MHCPLSFEFLPQSFEYLVHLLYILKIISRIFKTFLSAKKNLQILFIFSLAFQFNIYELMKDLPSMGSSKFIMALLRNNDRTNIGLNPLILIL